MKKMTKSYQAKWPAVFNDEGKTRGDPCSGRLHTKDAHVHINCVQTDTETNPISRLSNAQVFTFTNLNDVTCRTLLESVFPARMLSTAMSTGQYAALRRNRSPHVSSNRLF